MAKYVPPHLRNRQAQTEAAEEVGARDDTEAHTSSHRNGYNSVAHSGGSFSARSGGGRVGQSEAGGRFDCLKQGMGGGFGGGNKDVGGKGGPRNGGRDGDWYHRPDGRRVNGWDSMSEYAVFGEKRSNTGINFDDYDKIPVKVSGRNIDATVKIDAFAEASLSPSLFDNLVRCGYERPTPVQKHSIAIVCDGRDVMACAQTGSGKTCAFMVPAIECLLRSGPPLPPTEGRLSSRRTPMPCVLVMAPTRELTVQIFEESRKFSFNTGIRCCVVYGGADMRDQRRELNGGCDVLVATPGRLNDMFDRGLVSLAFIQFLILDEADRMLDMGFEPQVRKIVEETDMSKLATRPRQSMMFSATFPREVQMMAKDFLADYVFLTVGRVGSASELVEQFMQYTEEREKAATLEGVLDEHLPKDGLALVFVETKRGADDLERELYRMGMPVTTIHGDRSQYERESALSSFRSGRTPILVATDVASRGLDIPNVHVVVNYDMPNKIDDYVHRIGRTGRAGRKGKAVAFVNEKVGGPLLRELLDVLLDANQEPPSWFEAMCRQTRYGGGGGGGGGYRGRKGGGGGGGGNRSGKGGGGGGGHRFGGRDARYDGGDWR